ncbi:MAG: T9SS C-terminal target domain-containing protein, partial [Bacillota bacterium]|nr:T9SS C-terminal target domain-containing protein [Bacillota bacterium]
TLAAVNKLVWGPQVEAFNTPKLNAPFTYYKALRATHPLGPWTLIDSVGKRDPRYFHDSVYVLLDTESNIGDFLYYAVISVDSLGGKSGMTNITKHETQAPAAKIIGKVYVVPNPLIVTSGLGGSDPGGEVTDKVQFMGLTKRCTIRIFSYSGQLINTIEHDRDTFGNPWYQISRNNQILASGVYFFVVEDESGARSRGKFVIIH